MSSKKQVDHPELRAQLEKLSNKELHYKCVEFGMNVPVADSTRDVIIRKIIKSITGDTTLVSPKTNKNKKPSLPGTPTDRRKTVNVTVHVSSDEEEAAATERQRRAQIANTSTQRTRTQSPKGYNVTFDTTPTTINNNDQGNGRARNTSAANTTTKASINQQSSHRIVDANANAGVGLSSSSRIVPIEVDDYNIEVRRSRPGTNMYNSTPMQVEHSNSGYTAQSTNLGFSKTNTSNSNNYQHGVRDIPVSGGGGSNQTASPILGYNQMRNTTLQQSEQNHSQTTYPSRTLGLYSPGSSPEIFNNENRASHSSTMGNQYGNPPAPPTQETLFKRPQALSTSNISNTSYNQADAQRLYPRLPTDLATPPPYTTPPSSYSSSPQSPHSGRAPSLSKSGVMTTAYYQEISPVKDVKHFEVEEEELEDDYNGNETDLLDGSGDYSRRSLASVGGKNYERSTYLTGLQRGGAEQHLPFEPHLQSTTLHDSYASSPRSRETYTPKASAAVGVKPSPPLLNANKRYSGSPLTKTSYTRSIDEPDSGSETEKLSGDEIYVEDSEDEDVYTPGDKRIYSSFGSNKIQERVPYRRSAAKLSASPPVGALYARQSAMGAHHLGTGLDNDDDDVNASLRNFLTTLDRKYHIKQMLYMFVIFAAAVFVYVLFFEKEEPVVVTSKVQRT